ncbi:MAG: hypothetical protein IPO28_14025 [Holophagaceae bacterium]|nr:hypothetical protein [Holophagaceae bacterium]
MRGIGLGRWLFLLGATLLSFGCRELVEAPVSLAYGTNPAVYTVGTAIPTNSPTNGGGKIESYSVSPALPAGLNLDATSGAITGTPTAATAASTYTVTGVNTAGSATASLTITVNAKPPAILITTQPASQSILVGETATFTVVATGTGSLSYQWAKNGVAIPAATSSSYTTPVAVLGDSGSTFAVDISDGNGNILTSSIATLTVTTATPPITITTQPASQSIQEGQTCTFSVAATGTGPLTYQWSLNGTSIPGATAASHTTPPAAIDDNGSTFSVAIHNTTTGDNLTSATATLTVVKAPTDITITSQPANQSILVGQIATFSVVATGPGTLTYVWQKNGTPIPGATSASYTTPVTVLADNGSTYEVVISDGLGHVLGSALATLTVLAGEGPGAFTPTSGMSVSRVYGTVTTLANGKVLVAGGYNEAIVLNSADLFDSSTESFASTGSLATARRFHTATLLADGRVLVTGGSTLSTTTATAELFDPATGTFTATGNMIHPRADHSATLLPSGKVLIVGGGNGGAFQATAELFDPATGTFADTTNTLGVARAGHTATLLGNGKVLIVGGMTSGALASAELYDPALGTFTPTGGMAVPRAFHTATLLATGKVLVVGGAATATAEIFDPLTETFANTSGNLGTGRSSHTATLLPTGKVLIAGGSGLGSPSPLLGTAELYDPASGTFSSTGSLNGVRKLHMASPLATGKVLIVGGYSGVSFLASAELYN